MIVKMRVRNHLIQNIQLKIRKNKAQIKILTYKSLDLKILAYRHMYNITLVLMLVPQAVILLNICLTIFIVLRNLKNSEYTFDVKLKKVEYEDK
jgi:hypothetical protein